MVVAVEQAAEAIDLAYTDPHAARALALRARDNADGPEALSMSERALGLAAIECAEPELAIDHLRAAVAAAEAGDLVLRAAEARMTLGRALALRGWSREALAEVDRAAGSLSGLPAARNEMQRAMLLHKLGDRADALAGYDRALAAFRSYGDTAWEARALCNRGVLHATDGALDEAEDDLRTAERHLVALGQDVGLTLVRHNLGWVAACRGDVPAALRWYDVVEADYVHQGLPLGPLFMDRCALQLSAHLVADARRSAEAAVRDFAATEMRSDLAEAWLRLSEAALLERDVAAAHANARLAEDEFAHQDRPAWVALARYAALRARWLADSPSPELTRDASAVAEALAGAGWRRAALDAHLIAGRAALAHGRADIAERELALAAEARDAGPVALRTRAWHAVALLRLARGERRAALSAVETGLRAVDAHRTALGATELRVHAAAHGEELALLNLRLAVDGGRAGAVLRAADRWRATTLRLPPVLPPEDPELEELMRRLRFLVADATERVGAGEPLDERLERRQAALERAIRARTLHADGARGRPDGLPAMNEVQSALGHDLALVDFVSLDGDLLAVTCAGGRLTLRRLAATADVLRELAHLHLALRRLVERGSARARELVRAASQRLDGWLIAPLLPTIGERGLVVVPVGALHSLPWALMPSCSGRPVTVSPSLNLWLRTRARPGASAAATAPTLVAGPGLPHAGTEIEALAEAYPGAHKLTGAEATAGALLQALGSTDELAHIAAHGEFRVDNPLFSSLRVADGPLYVYDLERLAHAPRLLILSACDSARADVAGEEMLGLSAALFAVGTCTLVAGVTRVPDADTRELMVALHRRLRAGDGVASALAAAQAEVRREHPDDAAAWAGFVCLGAG